MDSVRLSFSMRNIAYHPLRPIDVMFLIEFYLKSPKPSNWKFFVEISNIGQIVGIAEVNMRVGAEQIAHLIPDKLILNRHRHASAVTSLFMFSVQYFMHILRRI